MRFDQQISAYSRPAAIAALILCLFASGRPVSASGQVAGAPQTPTPAQAAVIGAQGPLLQITADEAVKMALENNLGIQGQRLSPQIQALLLSQTRAAYAPLLFSNTTKSSTSNPPQNFLVGNDFTTNAGVRNNTGFQQLLKWGGGRYTASIDGSRNTTSDRTDAFNPRLSSNFNLNYTQPLLRDFSIDSTRQQLLIGQKQQEIVDVQLQQQVTQTARAVRSAYFDLVGGIRQLEVSRESLELANESLRNNEKRVEVGTIPPIDIVEAQAEVSRNEEAVIINEARIKSLEDVLRTLIMNPSQPDYWTARIVPAEEPVLTPQAVDVEGAIRNALDKRTDLAQARKQLEQTDIGIKFARNQRLPGINAIVNYGLAGLGGTRTIYEPVGRRASPADRHGAAQFRGRVAGRLRQRLQDLERPAAGELSHRHERSRGGARPGPGAAPAGRHEPARARAAGHGRGARRGAAGGHDPEARRRDPQSARVRREAVRGGAEADDRRPVDDLPGVPGAARPRRSSSSPSSTRSSPTTSRW